MFIARLAVLGIFLLLCACAPERSTDATAPANATSVAPGKQLDALVDAEVRSIATYNAIADGVDLKLYDDPVVSLDSSGVEPIWRVTFKMKSPALEGSYYMVPVTDRMRKASFTESGERVPPNTSLERTRER